MQNITGLSHIHFRELKRGRVSRKKSDYQSVFLEVLLWDTIKSTGLLPNAIKHCQVAYKCHSILHQ